MDEIIHRSAVRHPDKVALIGGNTIWSYAALDKLADQIANGLIDAGVRPGQLVAILSRNSHWYVALRYAVSRVGGVFVPLNFMLSVQEVSFILSHSGASVLFMDSACAETGVAAASLAGTQNLFAIRDLTEQEPILPALRLFEEMLAHDKIEPVRISYPIAQIIYTSGTESRPKGAMLTHSAIMWQYQSCIESCDWRTNAVVANALPLFHCAQLDAILGPSLQAGATNIILPGPAPALLIETIKKHGVTSLFGPPTMWIDLLQSPLFDADQLRSLTHGYYGASSMPREVLRSLMAGLPAIRLWNLYGQTEIAPVATVLQPEDQQRKLGSVGRAVLHVESRVVGDDMIEIGSGSIGEIVHRSPQLMSGYWRDPQGTAAAFEGGWFHSGDLATVDEDGYIYVVDRKKDMIKSGGENVASREVEEEIYTLAEVSEVAVIGVPDPRWVEVVVAFVVLRQAGSIDAPGIIRHCRKRLAGFKTPKKVFIVDALPRNAGGKILKRELRESVLP